MHAWIFMSPVVSADYWSCAILSCKFRVKLMLQSVINGRDEVKMHTIACKQLEKCNKTKVQSSVKRRSISYQIPLIAFKFWFEN